MRRIHFRLFSLDLIREAIQYAGPRILYMVCYLETGRWFIEEWLQEDS